MLTFSCVILSILVASSAQTIDIKLQPLSMITDPDLLFFQPYFPEPSEPTSCSGETETVCGGTFPLDLASGDVLSFQFDASSSENGDKSISIQGQGESRTRIEFQAIVENCESEAPAQEFGGADITFTLNTDGIDTPPKYNFNMDNSFVDVGPCTIFTRLQFDADESGVLDMNFHSITFSVNYDPQQMLGETSFTWDTDGYTWIRKPEEGAIELLDTAPVSTVPPTPSPTPKTTDPPTPSPTTSRGYFIGHKGFDLVSSFVVGGCMYLLYM